MATRSAKRSGWVNVRLTMAVPIRTRLVCAAMMLAICRASPHRQ